MNTKVLDAEGLKEEELAFGSGCCTPKQPVDLPAPNWLEQAVASVPAVCAQACKAAEQRLDALAKPPGSLGELEHLAVRLAGCTGQVKNRLSKRCVLVFAADNGVVEEGVASGPQSLTAIQAANMVRGLTGVAVLARCYHSDVWVTDVGIARQDLLQALPCPKLRRAPVALGTRNLANGPAMTRAQALQALYTGWQTAAQAASQGYNVLGIGEMGIGNTTTSSCVLCGLLGLRGEATACTVGRGAGLVDDAFLKKASVVRRALQVNNPSAQDPVEVLATVGGFDLAAMTGAFLGAAAHRLPVVIDGFISVVAALAAVRLCKNVGGYLIASHASHEQGYILALNELGLHASLALDMRLGEGSGCPVMFSVLDGACAVMETMATFEEAGIDTAYLDGLDKQTSF